MSQAGPPENDIQFSSSVAGTVVLTQLHQIQEVLCADPSKVNHRATERAYKYVHDECEQIDGGDSHFSKCIDREHEQHSATDCINCTFFRDMSFVGGEDNTQWLNCISHDGSTLMAYSNTKGNDVEHWSTAVVGSLLVSSRRPSDVPPAIREYADFRKVKRVIRADIDNSRWREVWRYICEILKHKPCRGDIIEEKNVPKRMEHVFLGFCPGDMEFLVLLGTPDGAGVVRLLRDHPDLFGLRACVTSIWINPRSHDMHLELGQRF